jgi:hypothetical protein
MSAAETDTANSSDPENRNPRARTTRRRRPVRPATDPALA